MNTESAETMTHAKHGLAHLSPSIYPRFRLKATLCHCSIPVSVSMIVRSQVSPNSLLSYRTRVCIHCRACPSQRPEEDRISHREHLAERERGGQGAGGLILCLCEIDARLWRRPLGAFIFFFDESVLYEKSGWFYRKTPW